ncbi:MAG: sulfotransferase [Phycisphaeraceae bacterium]|nr:sulfotransferase [Phycisphaeraceae bacterium]
MSGVGSRHRLNEAAIHYRAGRLHLAEAIAKAQVGRSYSPPEACRILGLIALRREAPDDALGWFGRAAAVVPGEVQFPYLMGKACAMAERYDEAMGHYERALQIDSGHGPSRRGMSVVLERSGDPGAALDVLRPLLEAGSVDDETVHLMVRALVRQGAHEEAVSMATRWLEGGERSARCRQLLGYLVGQSYERLGAYDKAFEAFAAANAAEESRFDPSAFRAYIERIRRAFCERHPLARGLDAAPGQMVYVAGMPRSGTTLVETILDAHPDARGVGENGDLHRAVADACGSRDPFPEGFAGLSTDGMDRIGASYLEGQRKRAPGVARVVNKHLLNWLYIGAIASLAPGSRVIWVRRDPRDNCLSMFTQHFNVEQHGYATDFASMAAVYREHTALMRFWIAQSAAPVLEVQYESLVEDPDSWMRRIVEFCGLPWDDRCQSFHTTQRSIRTHSYDQVRRPIFTSSVGRWRRYRKHLEPLLRLLGDDACDERT